MNLISNEMVTQNIEEAKNQFETKKQIIVMTNEYATKMKELCISAKNSFLCSQNAKHIFNRGIIHLKI